MDDKSPLAAYGGTSASQGSFMYDEEVDPVPSWLYEPTNLTSSSESSINDNDSPTSSSNTKPASKRKRAPKELLLRVNKDIIWSQYTMATIPSITLIDPASLLPINCIVQVGQVDKSAIVEADMCGVFRQNQFKLQCTLQGPLSGYSTPPLGTPSALVGCIATQPQQLVNVDGLYFHLYAFRQNDTGNIDNDPVPLHQVGPSRTKRDTQPPELLAIGGGVGVFDKLQFQASTHLGSGSHFRVVVCVVAKVANRMYNVCSSISPKFIVHARNPGRCAGKLTKKPMTAIEGTTTTTSSPPTNQSDTAESQFKQESPPINQPGVATAATLVSAVAPSTDAYHNVVATQQFITTTTLQQLNQTTNNYRLPPLPFTSPQLLTTTAGPVVQTSAVPSNDLYSVAHSSHIPLDRTLATTTLQQTSLPSLYTTPGHYAHLLNPQQTFINPQAFTPPHSSLTPPQPLTPPQLYTPPQQSFTPPQQVYSPPQRPTPEQELENVQQTLQLPYPPQDHGADNIWAKNGDATYYYGRVGINTNTPQESLTVHGNILVTGNVLKPSDYRLKDNFIPVNPTMQLNVINNIKIYDYDVQVGSNKKRERGVIAQEVAKLLPGAVQQIGDFKMHNGQTVDNLLVVNERVLLLENIGATQQLHQIVDEDRAEIDAVANKINELEEEEWKNSSMVMSTLQSMAAYVLSEDFREGVSESCIHCGFSLFGLGPAWSMFVLGFVFPPVWLLGALYTTAKNPVKKVAGMANIMMAVVFALLAIGFIFLFKKVIYRLVACVLLIGVIFLIGVSYFRRRREKLRHKLVKSDFLEKIKATKQTRGENRPPNSNNINNDVNRRAGKPSAVAMEV